MKLKAIGTSFAVAATIAGTALASSPAQALVVGGGENVLNIGGDARFESSGVAVGGNSTLNFFNYSGNFNSFLGILGGSNFGLGNVGNSSTGIFESARGNDNVVLQDLTLQKTSATTWSLLAPVDEFLSLSNGIKYRLDTFNLVRTASSAWEADFTGLFTGNLPGIDGVFTTQGRFLSNDGSTYSASVTAIPTPALLPGLVGMGLAALRKRKDESSKEAEA